MLINSKIDKTKNDIILNFAESNIFAVQTNIIYYYFK